MNDSPNEAKTNSVSEVTRLNIIDVLRAKKVIWHGRLNQITFLSRLYDLKSMPSNDKRYDTAEEDLQVHTIQFPGDWDDDWIFTDERFNLQRGVDENFLRFLCEMLNPLVRPDPKEVNALVKICNKYLADDGWELYTKGHISRRRVFGTRLIRGVVGAEEKPRNRPPGGLKAHRDHDVFICHASEDKESVARPLAQFLSKLGYRVWFDEFTLKLGDSLRRSIDRGLTSSRYGVVILSKNFFAKNWPQYELDALVQRENEAGYKVILPIWHNITRTQVAARSPTLADRLATVTSKGLKPMCEAISDVLGTPGPG